MPFDYRNRHDLYRRTGPGPHELCPMLVRRDRAELRTRQACDAEYCSDTESLRRLGELEPHDEACTVCHGANIVRPLGTTISYWCRGCGLTGQLADFEESSCLGLGAGHYEEQRDLHPLWHEDNPEDPRDLRSCPVCAEQRMLRAFEARQVARRVDAEQQAKGVEALAALL